MNLVNKSIDSEVFLEGKYVYLRTPNIEKDVKGGRWFSWFNDKKVTRYLAQGVYPNTVEKQISFVESLQNDTSRVLLCIIDKATQQHIGVIAFSGINHVNRKAAISLVIGEKKYSAGGPLEAMALMTEYGFDRLNLNRIEAGQCTELWPWVNVLELIGYRLEGYNEASMIRDGKIHDAVWTAILAERFYRMRDERGGNICTDDVVNLLCLRNRENRLKKINDFLGSLYPESKKLK